jgi:hypothetical protein
LTNTSNTDKRSDLKRWPDTAPHTGSVTKLRRLTRYRQLPKKRGPEIESASAVMILASEQASEQARQVTG